MGILDIFSKRKKENNKELFIYDFIPHELRVQTIHIWRSSIGEGNRDSDQIWDFIHDGLSREYGVFFLSDKGVTNFRKCVNFIQNEGNIERILDIIEISFRIIERVIPDKKHRWVEMGVRQKPEEAIEELNLRFQEHGIGYQYMDGIIVRVDSEFIHKEAVKPAVSLLHEEGFEGASEEFFNAHEHFRKGHDKEAIAEALKAFESVMKTICKRLGWKASENATATPLIKTLFENELLPASLQNHLSSVRVTLEGLATVRNKRAGHGQGEKREPVPRHMVAYALHLCATNIVFLVKSYKELKLK